MLELAGSSVVDWVQGLVTKALSELNSNELTNWLLTKFNTKVIHETLSTLLWWVKINVTRSIFFYETENDLLERDAGLALFD